jgi:hypothetical protein
VMMTEVQIVGREHGWCGRRHRREVPPRPPVARTAKPRIDEQRRASGLHVKRAVAEDGQTHRTRYGTELGHGLRGRSSGSRPMIVTRPADTSHFRWKPRPRPVDCDRGAHDDRHVGRDTELQGAVEDDSDDRHHRCHLPASGRSADRACAAARVPKSPVGSARTTHGHRAGRASPCVARPPIVVAEQAGPASATAFLMDGPQPPATTAG